MANGFLLCLIITMNFNTFDLPRWSICDNVSTIIHKIKNIKIKMLSESSVILEFRLLFTASGLISVISWPDFKHCLTITGTSRLLHNQDTCNFETGPCTAANRQFLHLTRLTFRSHPLCDQRQTALGGVNTVPCSLLFFLKEGMQPTRGTLSVTKAQAVLKFHLPDLNASLLLPANKYFIFYSTLEVFNCCLSLMKCGQ